MDNSYLESLKASVAELKRMHFECSLHLLKTDRVDPAQIHLRRDTNGRFILMDSLTAIVNAETALWLWR